MLIEEGRAAIELLASSLNEQLSSHDDYLIFLVRQCLNQRVSPDTLSSLITRLLALKSPKHNKELLITLADIMMMQQGNAKKALEIVRALYGEHPKDAGVQGRLLQMLVDAGELQEATKIQAKLPAVEIPRGLEEDDYVARLIEDGMPEKRKEKKMKDIVQETKGGAEIFMPTRKRKRQIKYPKNFDPKNPGPEPDHERWLPKWQRSRFKKIAKKKGIYLKGAQGDA